MNILAGPAPHPPRRALLSRPALQNWKHRIWRKEEREKYKRSGRQSLEGESSGVLGKNKIRAAAAHEQNG